MCILILQAALVPAPPGAAVMPMNVSHLTGFRPVPNGTPAPAQAFQRASGRDGSRLRVRERRHQGKIFVVGGDLLVEQSKCLLCLPYGLSLLACYSLGCGHTVLGHP